jgi:uncharacterized protein
MKKFLLSISLCFFLPAATLFSQQPAFKALAFYSFRVEMDHANFAHDAIYYLGELAKDHHFDFDTTSDWNSMSDSNLASYQLVIWLNGFPQNNDQRGVFERFMNKGGAWLGFHVSGFNLKNSGWDWFRNFMGGAMFHSNNWPPLPGLLIVENRDHPVTKGLPASYQSPSGEWYQWEPSPRLDKKIMVLVSMAPENFPLGIKSKISGGDTPVVWTNTGYKMLYINMGHGNKIFSNADQNRLITQAVLWLGGGAQGQ